MIKTKEDLDNLLDTKPFTLTEQQYDYVMDVCFGESHVSNFSEGGSGKSLCLEIIKEFLGDSCVVVATTGVANSILFNNKGGQGTLHSVMSLSLGMYTPDDVKSVSPKTREFFTKSDVVKVLIIEEAGMMNPDQLDLVRRRIETFNRPYGKTRGRRNIKIVLQGDLLQLGAILSDEEKDYIRGKYQSEFLPESSVYKSLNFSDHLFTQNLRATDNTFQEALKVIRYGEEHRYPKCIQWFNKRYQRPPEGVPVVTTTNKKVDEVNNLELKKNPNKLFKLKPIITGKYNIKNCPVDPEVHVKEGSPVIILINDNEGGKYANGSFGHVTQVVLGEGIYVKLALTGEEVFVPIFEFEEREYVTKVDKETGEDYLAQKVVGSCLHYCVKLAHALSVHRMQGKTLDTPYLIDLGKWGFNQNQDNDWGKQIAYVAFSRSTKIENIYLAHSINNKHLKVNKQAVEWVRSKGG